MNKNKFIPVCEPLYLGNEKHYARDAVKSGWISSSGGYIGKFEEKFSRYCGAKYGVATTSGTAALHLALLALGIKEGDEVIIPDFTMIAVLFAVLYTGAKPKFVDAEPGTRNMCAGKIKEKITRRTKAVIAVHTYGHPVDLGPVMVLCRKYGLYLVEDAAEAHGAEYNGRKCGSFGNISCFSFYANKIITTGEGGIVLTSDRNLAERCRYYKNLCFATKGKRNYMHADLGFNYRMTNVQAALGLGQLENIDEFIKKRRNNAKLYSKLLNGIPGLRLPIEEPYAKNVYWMYAVVVNPRKFGISRKRLMEHLGKNGVDTRRFFKPMHSQGVLKKIGITDKGSYPVTENLSKDGFYLPSGSGLKAEEIKYICEKIKKAR